MRQDLRPALKDAVVVVNRHLIAVGRRIRDGMSAHYHVDAVLERGSDRFVGREAIAAYFAAVPHRLTDRTTRFAEPIAVAVADGGVDVDVGWELLDSKGAVAASGRTRSP